MKIYLVGGAIRDQQLGLPVRERDWVVTGATTGQMLEKGFLQIDPAFPVFRHPETAEEYALARTEKKQGRGYKGFVLEYGPEVTLEQDLARRDLTINAIAMDESGRLIDPFHGLDDLRDGRLKHVTSAFVEDPVRLLRTARFASVLGQYGFSISHSTFALMKQMSVDTELRSIKPQRLLKEIYRALSAEQGWKFFKVLGKCGALDLLLPGINTWINGEQGTHAQDAAPILALRRATLLSGDNAVRLMSVMYSAVVTGGFGLAKYLPLEKNVQQLIRGLRLHGGILLDSNDAKILATHLEQAGAFRQGDLLKQLLLVLQAVFPQQEKRIIGLQQLHRQLLSQTAESLIAQGFTGMQLGEEIRRQRIMLIENWLVENRNID